jgi:hypothetical protein
LDLAEDIPCLRRLEGIAIFGLEQNAITCFDNELDTRRNTEGDEDGLAVNTV